MTNFHLTPTETFPSEADFLATQKLIQELVRSGELVFDGLDEDAPTFFVERYRDKVGTTWLLGIPDQAFRGFLRKK